MKKAFSIIATVFFVVAFATTGVFADSLTPLPVVSDNQYNSLVQQGVQVNSGSRYSVYFGSLSSNTDSLFAGAVPSSSPSGNYSYYVASRSSGQGVRYNNSASSTTAQTLTGHDVNPDVYYALITNSPNTPTSSCPLFSSLNEFLSAVASYGSSLTSTFYLSLPYGNALRIYSDSSFTITSRAYTVRDTTYNFQKYVRASDNFSYRVNGTYQGVVQNSSLVGNIGLSVYGSDNVIGLLVPWQPVNQNILGRATEYNYYSGSPDPTATVAVGSGESFLIWYPYYANNQDTSKLNEVPMDMAITIEYSSPVFFMTYPITGNPSAGEDIYISNTSDVSDGGSSHQTDDGDGNVTVTFDNAPTAGGNHGQAPINQNNSILGVLSNLQNTLLGLFNKAIDGIHNLISLGSSFLQSVQVMFSWLPAELLVIITSGFVILLTIGVLKTLWR